MTPQKKAIEQIRLLLEQIETQGSSDGEPTAAAAAAICAAREARKEALNLAISVLEYLRAEEMDQVQEGTFCYIDTGNHQIRAGALTQAIERLKELKATPERAQ
ncbi:hypothetical protein PUV47_01890 [Pseudovibrio exalbescens]|uniref:hypothetical protein n=1 Tax=Pseudovibrio exalbescens TaxID=197461 RepID=UPI0023656E8F|nr:hypothetical protein [Pseudovibrio exalbescens]MDD7908655.1 hypothetical protein [Pseudovibrio exalbescens]